jgi:hypothetical protein
MMRERKRKRGMSLGLNRCTLLFLAGCRSNTLVHTQVHRYCCTHGDLLAFVLVLVFVECDMS